MEEEIWEDLLDCGFCGADTAAMGMGRDAVCYGHYWHPLASDMMPICDACITFFDETSIDAAGELVCTSISCQQCGAEVVQPLMYWAMYRGGWWLCEACIATEMEAAPGACMPPPLPISVQVDETWVRRAATYRSTRIRAFHQCDARASAFVLADLCRALEIPSIDAARARLHEATLEMVWAADEQEPLLLVTEFGLYQPLMACYRQAQRDAVMPFIHWLWWEASIGEDKP